MTPKERAERALDRIWPRRPHDADSSWPQDVKMLEDEIDGAVAEERARCAKIAEQMAIPGHSVQALSCAEIARKIRET